MDDDGNKKIDFQATVSFVVLTQSKVILKIEEIKIKKWHQRKNCITLRSKSTFS